MATEIERKFLLRNLTFKEKAVSKKHYSQGYIEGSLNATVRIRTVEDKAYITIKGHIVGISRDEYEYEIPLEDARQMQERLCGEKVEKIRYIVWHEGKRWEVDEFLGANEGLFVAELELNSENESFPLPDWAGEEVTDDFRFRNSHLSKEPFSTWSEEEKESLSLAQN